MLLPLLPSLPSMPSQACPSCSGCYRDMLDHIRKKHPSEPFTALQLQPFGLVDCPTCHTACKGTHGIRVHQSRVHGIEGTSRVSTLPRLRDVPAPSAAPAQLTASNPFLARRQQPPPANRGRKRAANTPSPATQRPPLRPRAASSSSLDSDSNDPALEPWNRSHARARRPASPGPAPSSPLAARANQRPRSISSISSSSLPSISSLARNPEPASPRDPEPARNPKPPRNPEPAWNPKPASPRDPTLEERHQELLQPIIEKEPMKTLLAYSPVPIPEKRLHARHIQTFTQAANRTAEAFLKQPSEKALLDFLLLPRVLGIAYKNSQIPATLKAYPRTRPDPRPPCPPKQTLASLAQ